MTPIDDLWRGEVTAELRHIAQQLRDLDRRLAELRAAVDDRLAEHAAYHRAHEHHWGLLRLCQRHPFRTAAVAAVGALLLQPAWLERVLEVLRVLRSAGW